MSDESAKPSRFEPPASDAGRPFWEASRDQRLELPWCTSCDAPHWYPRDVCPHCLSDTIEWRPASGRGVVYACSTMPKAAMPLPAYEPPYVVAIVEVDEGVRILGNVVGEGAVQVGVGDAVVAAWEPLSDGRHLLVWSRADS